MDDILVNKYLGQFNPILIVPVLSAVVGAILVFVFGFKRPNEPRFQSSSTSDTLKKSKKKGSSGARSADSQTSKAQNATPQKTNKKLATNANDVAAKKSVNAVLSDKLNNIKKKEDKKTDEKKTETGTPVKKVAQKKATKDSPNLNGISVTSKKQQKQANKKAAFGEKPADFDDGNWFKVQSKSSKKANKVDENGGASADTSSPKTDSSSKAKSNKAKGGKIDKVEKTVEKKVDDSVVESAVPETISKDAVDEPTVQASVEKPTNVTSAVEKPVAVTTSIVDEVVPEKKEEVPAVAAAKPKPVKEDKSAAVDDAADENSAIAFDELGEWTDAKPDRKRGNKKKSRKD